MSIGKVRWRNRNDINTVPMYKTLKKIKNKLKKGGIYNICPFVSALFHLASDLQADFVGDVCQHFPFKVESYFILIIYSTLYSLCSSIDGCLAYFYIFITMTNTTMSNSIPTYALLRLWFQFLWLYTKNLDICIKW